jgi:glycosyltransferase involved in cell wall biosynthesis
VKVSLIIPSFRGAFKIPNILKALQAQSFSDFEVVLVIDSSVDTSYEVSQAFESTLRLTIIDRPNKGRAVTRNTGANHASGELLIFFDDDMRPVADCVEKHVTHHTKQYPSSILVGKPLEEIAVMKTDFQRYKAYLSKKWTSPLDSIEGPMTKENLFLPAANFSIPVSLFRQLGGFDERLSDAEDFDLAIRAFEQQIPIYFNGEAIAWHDDFVTCRSYINRLRQYQVANQYLKTLNPDLFTQYRPDFKHSTRWEKRMIYSCFSHKLWVDLIDHSPVFKALPVAVRYKLYDIITTGLAIYHPDRSI